MQTSPNFVKSDSANLSPSSLSIRRTCGGCRAQRTQVGAPTHLVRPEQLRGINSVLLEEAIAQRACAKCLSTTTIYPASRLRNMPSTRHNAFSVRNEDRT